MKKNWRFSPLAVAAIFALVFVAGCGGNNNATIVVSSTNPAIVYAHSAVTLNNAVYTWGYNGYGQLGNNSTVNFVFPTPISNLTLMAGSSAGGSHTLAVSNSGLVWAWGNNGGYGQLGNGLLTTSQFPVQVVNFLGVLGNITAVAAGGNHSLGLEYGVADGGTGGVWAWGANTAGQLANPTVTAYYSLYAVPVLDAAGVALKGIKKIAAGGSHNLAIDQNNEVLAWGYNNMGQLGNNSLATFSAVPVHVVKQDGTNLGNVGWIAAGGSHSLAVDNNGVVWVWGANGLGQLGQGNTGNPDSNVPFKPFAIKVPNLKVNTFAKNPISAGLDHSVAIDATGAVVAWGLNNYYQLANGSQTVNSDLTTANRFVLKYNGQPFTLIDNINQVMAIGHHNLAFDANMKGWSWGYNIYGQLGNGTVVNGAFAGTMAAPFL